MSSMERAEPTVPKQLQRLAWRVGAVFLVLLFGSLLLYSYLFGPMDKFASTTEFIVEPDTSMNEVAKKLEAEGFVRSSVAFDIAFLAASNGRAIRPGGYRISKAMDTGSIAETLARQPYFAWLKVTPGMRKEQIAEMLAEQLSWTPEEKEAWLTVYTAPAPSFIEGVYYPDTYLIPSDQTPEAVADRMRSRFQEVFAPYANEAAEKGWEWTDVLTMASLVEREASRHDKELVAAILWNRIDIGMPLQADAALQYIKGTEEKWWPVPTADDKYLESPFNTYKHVGLPPHPIANPSLDSIRATLNPQATDCLFYLHDNNGQIHCSVNYAGHVGNVNRYLK